jgi:hypothetical protein
MIVVWNDPPHLSLSEDLDLVTLVESDGSDAGSRDLSQLHLLGEASFGEKSLERCGKGKWTRPVASFVSKRY